MALECWLATPGLFLTAEPMSPAPKTLKPSGRTVAATTVPFGNLGQYQVQITVDGKHTLLDDPVTMTAFDFQGQTQFMVLAAAETIVVRYVGKSLTPGDQVRLLVVDLSAAPTAHSIDLGQLPLQFGGIPVVNVHPSMDGRLLFVYVQSEVEGAPDTFSTHWHRIVCTGDGAVICEFADLVVTTSPTSAMSAVQRYARVTPARSVEMMHTGLPPDGTVFESCPLPNPPGGPRTVEIVHIDFNPQGRDVLHERAILQNFSQQAVSVAGWTLQDAANHVFTFPPNSVFAAGPNAQVSIWTGNKPANAPASDLSWGSGTAIWNNAASGDTATLRRDDGSDVSIYVYMRPTGGGSGSAQIPSSSYPSLTSQIFDEFFVRVSGTSAVVDALVPCKVGEKLRITAEGDIWTRFPSGGNGPDGWDTLENGSGFPLNSTLDSHPFSLIGKLGPNGPIRYVGSSKLWPLVQPEFYFHDSTDSLYLGINDDYLVDNAGEFYVRVQKIGSLVPYGSYRSAPDVDQSFPNALTNGASDFDTGLTVRKGDRVLIDATGSYTPGGIAGGGATGPEGWEDLAVRDAAFPLGSGPNARKFALLFRYSESPYYMLAGASTTDVYESVIPSTLFLRINDDTVGGESGSFSVRVRIKHRRP